MNDHPSRPKALQGLALLLALGMCNVVASAQGAAPASRSAAVEPGVDTSAPRGTAAAPASGSRAAPPAAASPAAPVPAGERPAVRPADARRGSRASDRVDLEASQITGNRELPRVLYIVPWRAPAAGDLEGRPVNSLLYELTKPVDRDVFRRENRYFDALEAARTGAEPAPAGAPAPGSPEK